MAGKEKRRYINYRVDAYLRDRFLHSGRKHKPREMCGGGESLMRCINHVKFCVVCCASLSQAVAPWMLCALEVLAVLLIYFLATSRSLVIHHHHFSFTRSLEDVVGLTCTRAAILSLAYAIGQRSVHRPYLYAAYLLAAACLPYVMVKTILFRYGPDGVAATAILGLAGICSIGHVLAARRTVEWARRRYQMGLGGFGMPWEEGEDWHALRRPDLEDMTKTSDGGSPDPGEDVPAEMLADDDSKFVELAPGLKVHYKEVAPPATASSAGSIALGGPDSASTGIVLVHGFGGGVFAWRHVMETLAMQCHCRVVAFDRPGFGLTSRPKANELSNPYTVSSQSQLLLQLCGALGLRQVVLVAHADGCLVTLRAAATSASYNHQRRRYMQPQPVSSSLQPQLQLQPYASSTHARDSEHARSAPASAESSPKFTSGSPSSPALDQYLPHTAQQQQQQQAAGQQGPAAPAGTASCGGALSAAAFAAAAGEASVPVSHQLCPVTGAATLPVEWESGRGVVSADEVARLGTSSYHGSMSGLKGASAPGSNPSPHVSVCGAARGQHYHTRHLSMLGCGCNLAGCAVLGSSGGDVEVGSLRGEALEMDRASSSSTSHTIALSSQAHHRRAQSVPGPVAGHCCSAHFSDGWETGSCGSSPVQPHALPCVLGLVLLHPNLSGNLCSAFSRILARSNFGRAILRPLLRTEVGEIANRRAWHNADKLTSEVLEMYKTPLRVEGWDTALVETMKPRKEACQGDLHAYCDSVQPIPTLLATGEHDRIVPPSKSETLGADLPHARLALLKDCGHLSHEEAPSALLEQLVPFCGEVLSRAARRGSQGGAAQARSS